ncbi:MAG: hypothetical protein ACLFUU_11620 [Desulfobacteraceae bacterium]
MQLSCQKQQYVSLAKIGLAVGLVSWCLSGCAYPSYVESDYGRSVASNQLQQFVNPGAGLYETTASVGLSPTAGVKVNEKYLQSYEEMLEEREPFFGILEETE